ncbi:WSC domain-containing protein [Cryomyces antarcticus]
MVALSQFLLTAALVSLSLVGVSDAFWRLPCRARSGLGRIDPLVDSGSVADHVHAIHGGNNFGLSSTSDDLLKSSCTSCGVTEDLSAYWTPSLHFMHPNGTSVMVEQVGGMLAYYLLYGENIKAFPSGFAMLAGDKRLRNFTWPVPDPPKSDWSGDETSQFALSQKALGFNCLNYGKNPEPSLFRHFMPDKQYLDANCADGLRLELMFPSCWNGKEVNPDDHHSHVAYPSLVMTGECPSGFQTQLPSLFYETIWATNAFAGVEGQFLLSNGDPTGYGYHGDFIMGWDPKFLQNAVDTCTNLSGNVEDCPLFTLQSDSDSAKCTFEVPSEVAHDNPAGPRDGLALSVPVQAGPEYATVYPVVTNGQAAPSSQAPKKSSAAPSSIVTPPSMPTLSYSAATKTATDAYGGGIAVAQAVSSSAAASSAAAPSSAQATSPEASSAVTPSYSDAPSAVEHSYSQITSAPLRDNYFQGDRHANIVATSYMTKGHEAWEILIEEVEITVTASPTAAYKHRRHTHQRRNKHGAL